jgi:hypothetical protein
MSREDRAPFAPLIPDLCQVLGQLAETTDPKHLSTALQALQTTTETVDFFRGHVESHILPVLVPIAKAHQVDECRKYALEVLITFIESKPKVMVKVDAYVQQVLAVCVHCMMQLSDDVEEWAAQDEDEAEDDEEQFTFGKEAVDRISSCAKEEFPRIMEALKPTIPALFQSGEWKQVVAAISTLSQIAEYIDEEAMVVQMCQAVVVQLGASHPRVRYAAWGALAQFAQDHPDTITTSEWVAQLVPQFITALDDACPRVAIRSMEAFQHYGEAVERDDLEPFVPALMEKLGPKMQGTEIFLKKAITFVAVIAGQVDDAFAPYYPHLMPIIKGVIQSTLHKVEERTLLGKCFECISLLAKAVGREGFRGDAEVLMQAMIQATQVPNLPSNDPVKEYMMAATERICATMKEDFMPFVPHILPGVLEKLTLAPREFNDELNTDDLEEGAEVNLSFSQENGKTNPHHVLLGDSGYPGRFGVHPHFRRDLGEGLFGFRGADRPGLDTRLRIQHEGGDPRTRLRNLGAALRLRAGGWPESGRWRASE